MYTKCHKWCTFVRQSVGFVCQSVGHLLYKCTPNCGTWQKVRHCGISVGKPVLKGHSSNFDIEMREREYFKEF